MAASHRFCWACLILASALSFMSAIDLPMLPSALKDGSPRFCFCSAGQLPEEPDESNGGATMAVARESCSESRSALSPAPPARKLSISDSRLSSFSRVASRSSRAADSCAISCCSSCTCGCSCLRDSRATASSSSRHRNRSVVAARSASNAARAASPSPRSASRAASIASLPVCSLPPNFSLKIPATPAASLLPLPISSS
mmetsp:Transcript_13303/g.43506  ORF Transcript_13303/g.43506 Transcript_13303/m.43506 type:complete len:200 (-) Transcript_13303:68-667(-)